MCPLAADIHSQHYHTLIQLWWRKNSGSWFGLLGKVQGIGIYQFMPHDKGHFPTNFQQQFAVEHPHARAPRHSGDGTKTWAKWRLILLISRGSACHLAKRRLLQPRTTVNGSFFLYLVHPSAVVKKYVEKNWKDSSPKAYSRLEMPPFTLSDSADSLASRRFTAPRTK